LIGSGIVAPLKKAQIEAFSLQWRRGLGYRDDRAVSMPHIIEIALPQVFPDFHYDIVPDVDLRGAEATTSLSKRHMKISQSTYDAARRGAGRPAFTLAHELGHLLLHCQRPVELARGQARQAYRDPEWQADQFASAFLIPEAEARKLCDPGILASRFGTTPAAARVRLQKLGVIPGRSAPGGAM
jgi:hypothetical protein